MKYVLLLVLIAGVNGCSFHPRLCTCYNHVTLVFCVDKDMSQPPTFPSRILTYIKHLNLIGNRIAYVTPDYIKLFPSIITVDLRAQRVAVNCTLLNILQNIVKSDCPRIFVNDTSNKTTTQEPELATIPTQPPIIRTRTRKLALSLGILCILVIIIISLLAKGYTTFCVKDQSEIV